MVRRKDRRKQIIRKRRLRKQKLKKLREKYTKTKTEIEKQKIFEKAKRISPKLTLEQFLAPIKYKNKT